MNPVLEQIAARNQSLFEQIAKGSGGNGASLLARNGYAWSLGKSLATVQSLAAEPELMDEATGAIPFIITKLEIDRDGDIVRPLGLRWHNYATNAVVCWSHQTDELPIGTSWYPDKTLAVWPDDNRVRALWFPDKGDPDAMFIHGKVVRGVLSACSISFVPMLAFPREQQDKSHRNGSVLPTGWDFVEAEVTEWSLTAVGANSGALRDALDSEKSFISPRLQKSLRSYAAIAKGRCFSGYCPCPPCEDAGEPITGEAMSKDAKVADKLPKKKHACGCKSGKPCGCKVAKVQADMETNATEAPKEQMKGELEDCVSRKIPLLVKEGYEEAQSQAIAFSMCGEGKKDEDISGHEEHAAKLKAMFESSGPAGGYVVPPEEKSAGNVVAKKDTAEDDEEPTEHAESEAESHEGADANANVDEAKEDAGKDEKKPDAEAEENRVPHSQKFLAHVHAHHKALGAYIDHELPVMDNKAVKKFAVKHKSDVVDGAMKQTRDVFEAEHPDGDMDTLVKNIEGGGAEGEAAQVQEGDTPEVKEGSDDPARQEILDREDSEDADKSNKEILEEYQQIKSWKKAVKKSCGDMHMKCMKDAADHMTNLAGQADVPDVHKAGLMYHAKALMDAHKEMGDMMDKDDKLVDTTSEQTVLDPLMEKEYQDLLSDVIRESATFKNNLFQLTGIAAN